MKIACRTCKVQIGEFFTLDSGIFIGNQEYKLIDIANECLHLDANLGDQLPQFVCAQCLGTLKLFYPFLLKAVQSNNELKEQLIGTEIDEQLPATMVNDDEDKPIFVEMFDCIQNNVYEGEENASEAAEQVNEKHASGAEIVYEINDTSDACYYEYDESYDYEDFIVKDDNSDCSDTESQYATSNASEFQESAIVEIGRLSNIENSEIPSSTLIEPLKEIRKFECFDCGRKYGSLLNLEKHRQLHNVKENRQCQVCDARFETAFEFNEHMKSHIEERKFICEFCNKPFMTRASLKSHLLCHYNIRPFKCERCGKTFQQKSILKTHMTLHTGKTIECHICKRRFSRTAHLNIHLRQHYNIRPYKCEQCSNTYMQKSHLDRHIASSHIGIRYDCSVCGRSYTKQSTLNAHMRQEHEEHY